LVRKLLTIIGFLWLATTMHAGETAILRNGFSISHDHRQQIGANTRLFLSASDQEYVDVATDNILSFEKEDLIATPPAAKVVDLSPSLDVDQIVEKAARENELDSDFVRAVIRAESQGNAKAISPKGAQGLMQLMPGTAAKLGVKNIFDPNENVDAGTRYLRYLLSQYHNDPVQALAAYNAGAGRVQQYHGVPPYKETRTYVAKIIRDFNRRKLEQAHATKKSGKSAQASAANHPPGGD
jgi:soluble lytic murein transglycosylase-like protein